MPHQLNFSLMRKYDSAKGGIVIPVSLILAEKVIECQAKVDTGAEHCLFARNYADQLGLDVESGHYMEMGTLTASFPAFGHVITLQTLNMAFESTVYFPQSYEIRRNLLGRNGWLHFVRLGIIAYDEIIYLGLYDDLT